MVFSSKKDNSFYQGKWIRKAFKSLSSYIQLLEQIVSCYKNNYVYFKLQGKHSIKRSSVLSSCENVRTVTVDNFNWLMKHADQFSEVPYKSGIQFLGKTICRIMLKQK